MYEWSLHHLCIHDLPRLASEAVVVQPPIRHMVTSTGAFDP